MNVSRVEDVGEFLKACQRLVASSQVRPWRRGEPDELSTGVVPRIFRPNYSPEREQSTMKYFHLRAPVRHAERPAAEAIVPWLFLAQHYGLPTPSLDWSLSYL
jgi:hypothetical protein